MATNDPIPFGTSGRLAPSSKATPWTTTVGTAYAAPTQALRDARQASRTGAPASVGYCGILVVRYENGRRTWGTLSASVISRMKAILNSEETHPSV